MKLGVNFALLFAILRDYYISWASNRRDKKIEEKPIRNPMYWGLDTFYVCHKNLSCVYRSTCRQVLMRPMIDEYYK